MLNLTEQTKESIYRDFYAKVFGYMVNRTRDKCTAEDLCSAVFTKVFEKAETFDDTKASLSTWIYTISRNALYDYYKTRKTFAEMPDDLPDGSDVEEEICNAETLANLADALGKLNERERAVIILKYYRGISFVKIAKKMGISYAYVKVLHVKALSHLKKQIKL